MPHLGYKMTAEHKAKIGKAGRGNTYRLGKTQKNREYGEAHFTEIIETKYGGKCYLERDQ